MTKVAVKAAYVEWEDSAYRSGWREGIKAAGGPCSIHSVGIVVDEGPAAIVLATSHDGEESYLQQVAIPRSAIRKLRRIKL